MNKEVVPVVFPEHFGFCEGVKAADTLLKDVTKKARDFGIDTVYGYHEIVHNDTVIDEHKENGVCFVYEIDKIPDNSVVITSAHGVGPEIMYELERKGSTVFEAVCPKVLHTHLAVQKARKEREKVIYVCKGKPGYVEKLHDEVEGILGHLDYSYKGGVLFADAVERSYVEISDELSDTLLADGEKYRIITQTTLDADESLEFKAHIADFIKSRQPDAKVNGSDSIGVCRAVTNRQIGVAALVALVPEQILVATDEKSKNGMGYVKLAKKLIAASGQSTEVYHVATIEEAENLGKIDGLTGLTASASTPDETTFGIARVLGLSEMPELDRRSFNLKDGKPDVIKEKLKEHAAKIERLNA